MYSESWNVHGDWGLVCKCCSHIRHSKKRAKCPRASRRLPEARKVATKLANDLVSFANTISLTHCEGAEWIFLATSYTLRFASQVLKRKSACYKMVPWLMSEADDPEVCGTIAEQLRAVDRATACPLLRGYVDELLPHVEALSFSQLIFLSLRIWGWVKGGWGGVELQKHMEKHF